MYLSLRFTELRDIEPRPKDPVGSDANCPFIFFAAGDDHAARAQVLELARDIGFDPVDAGPLVNARWLEAMGYMQIQLGYALGLGPAIGFALVR